jgi:N-sulfoglucosamine sulfohydrolase
MNWISPITQQGRVIAFCLAITVISFAQANEIAGRSLSAWTKDLSVSNETIQLRAAKMIGQFGEPAVPQLTKMLSSENDAIRYWAASHLGNIGSDASAASEALKTAVNDPSLPVRMAINFALSRVDRAGPWFVSLIKGVESSDRSTACAAADFFARIGPSAKSVIPTLQSVFEKQSSPGGDYHIAGGVKNALRNIRNTGELEHHVRPSGGGPLRDFGAVPLKQGPKPRSKAAASAKPNILWISCEDISANLGSYGDNYASTPHLDKLADQGVRFTRAFTPSGVCAINRTGIITGKYPISYGGQHMRISVPFPDGVKCFPEYLREAGYFCSNKTKTDYQSVQDLSTVWDKQGAKYSDWRDRAPGQPFFSVINLTISHESQIRHGAKTHASLLKKLKPGQAHDPNLAGKHLPPIYADTAETRKDWAWYQDNISEMDRQAGLILDRLEADGLVDNTIVVFWSDHGRGLARGKRWIYDSGVHVPMIVRWPGQLPAGSLNEELVSTQDLTRTTLSLAGVQPKDYMHGRVFLGKDKQPEPEFLFFHRDRMDEALEFMRAARDHRFKYIRNFEPERTYAQHIDYMDKMPSLVDMRRMHKEGKLNPVQSLWFSPRKPFEELYDVIADPHETKNLAALPQHQQVLKRMRQEVEQWQVEVGDLSLIPEAIMIKRLTER